MTAPVSQVLSEAADLLEKPGGWMQGDFCNAFNVQEATCFCIEGAIAHVKGWQDCMKAEQWCDRHLSPLVLDGRNAAQWNDDICTSGAEAAAKLREAAALAKEQGR